MEINKPVTTIILLIVTLILAFLFVVPKYQESVNLQVILNEKQAEYDGESDYYTKIFGLLKNIKDRKDSLDKMNSALPSNVSFAPLIYFLQEKVTENGLTVKLITFSDIDPSAYGKVLPVDSDQIKNIVFAVDLSGSYQGLKKFLYSLEKSARLFQINNITVTSFQSLQSGSEPQIISQNYDFKLEVKTNAY